jgi:hypothetical protein
MSGSSVPLLDQQPDQTGKHSGKCRKLQRRASRLPDFEIGSGNVVVNMAALLKFHQHKGHDETDRRPF